MEEKKVILLFDEYSRNSYLHTFMIRYKNYFPGLCILNVCIEKWEDFRINESIADGNPDLFMPFLKAGMLPNDEKCIKLGNRIIDFLILEKVIDPESRPVFILNNTRLFFLPALLKERTNGSVIAYIDTFQWEYRPAKEYFPAATIFRTAIKKTGEEKSLSALKSKREATLFENSDHILCYTDESSEFINKVYDVPLPKLTVWAYSRFQVGNENNQQDDVQEIRKNLLIYPNEKVLLFYCSPGQRHILGTFLRIIENITVRYPCLRAIIVGNSFDPDVLEDVAPSVLSRTVFLGDRKPADMTRFIHIADVVVTLPEREIKNSFCLDTLENGKPLITTALAIPDSIREKFNSIIVTPLSDNDPEGSYDPTVIGGHIQEVLEGRWHRKEISGQQVSVNQEIYQPDYILIDELLNHLQLS